LKYLCNNKEVIFIFIFGAATHRKCWIPRFPKESMRSKEIPAEAARIFVDGFGADCRWIKQRRALSVSIQVRA